MSASFFNTRNYLIYKKKEKSNSRGQFKIYNGNRECIGFITKKKSFSKIAGLKIFPYLFEIRNANGVITATLSRGFLFFCDAIVIKDFNGNKIGSIKRQFSLFKQNIKILNNKNQVIAEIRGNKKDSCLAINIEEHITIGEIKQCSLRKTILQSCNKYDVVIEEIFRSVDDKMAIVSCALTFGIL
ncbi:hypothetical protein EYY60_08205 [Flavobacterium zhairuonense]|uniref:hypothetical protein n=1 Tax=Flavobacterium zhairuonense TaxID=2493631 RepID=UPI001044E746|nr:hypothetical protein [Flavobacterium zhairuonense]KAF2511405.1 hypothetical protein EYY60_08205 [Flavobacterium zhairuonense]